MPSSGHVRRERLINGRRVRISDLVEAGLLQQGQELFLEGRVGKPPQEAFVTERGRLRFPDGREFATPSAASTAGGGPTAGWWAWRAGPDGPRLHELRRRLLQSVAEEVTSDQATSGEEAEAVRRRFDFLEEARTQAENGRPKIVTVREFIRLWGYEDRDRATSAQIDADLANHGLTTVPDFRAVSLDRTVRLDVPQEREETDVRPGAPLADTPAGAPLPTAPATVGDASEEDGADIGLTLGNLLSDDDSLVFVSPDATFEEAITAMQLNDFSQLAVLANPYELHGAVSWESIAAAKHLNPDAGFSDAIDRGAQARVFDYDTRLLDVLNPLQQDGFIFIRNYERKIAGIITAADVVHKYDETATPFFLIGEIDQELRKLIQNAFDEQTVGQVCKASGQTFKAFDNMTIGQYQTVLRDPDCWAQLGWPLDRDLFIERLDQLRKVRNNVMHFNPDPVRPSEVTKLRNFLKVIRKYSA